MAEKNIDLESKPKTKKSSTTSKSTPKKKTESKTKSTSKKTSTSTTTKKKTTTSKTKKVDTKKVEEKVETNKEIKADTPIQFQKQYDYENAELLLKVKHLKQYFKFKSASSKYLKAVHDVSFDVYKGEVFGLVGESGCGKSTTGRDILKLYKITSGDIFLDGIRIAAGTRWNQKEIKFTNIRLKESLRKFKTEKDDNISKLQVDYINAFDEKFDYKKLKKIEKPTSEQKEKDSLLEEKLEFVKKYEQIINDYNLKVKTEKDKAYQICSTEKERIKLAKKDDKNYNKNIAKQAVSKVEEEYKDFIADYNANYKNSKKKFDDLSKQYNQYSSKLNKAQSKQEKDEIDKTYSTLISEYQQAKIEFEQYNNKYSQYKADIKKAKATNIANKVQMIFQDPIASLNPRMTVRNIISEGLVIQGVHDKEYINKEVERVLKLVGLVPEHANRYPHEFSGGQRQRIGIARAIIMKPELIVADEPVSALDVSIQAQVINLLNDLRNDLGLTIIFIAHNLSVVKYFCDRIAVMYYGNLVELATADELFAHPLHPYTKSLLSAVPYPDPNIEANRKRIIYNPQLEHDYSIQKPTMRELEKGHFVLCNDVEEEKYKEELKQAKSIYAR